MCCIHTYLRVVHTCICVYVCVCTHVCVDVAYTCVCRFVACTCIFVYMFITGAPPLYFRQTDLDPTSMTYTVLAMGFAERGEVEEVKKVSGPKFVGLLLCFQAFSNADHFTSGVAAESVTWYLQGWQSPTLSEENIDIHQVCLHMHSIPWTGYKYRSWHSCPRWVNASYRNTPACTLLKLECDYCEMARWSQEAVIACWLSWKIFLYCEIAKGEFAMYR